RRHASRRACSARRSTRSSRCSIAARSRICSGRTAGSTRCSTGPRGSASASGVRRPRSRRPDGDSTARAPHEGIRAPAERAVQEARRMAAVERTFVATGARGDAAVVVLAVASLVWIGALLGVSFLATPVKFLAPSLTLPVALDVGRQTFHWLNRVEIVLAAATLVSACVYDRRR